jgi:hypothetical protein
MDSEKLEAFQAALTGEDSLALFPAVQAILVLVPVLSVLCLGHRWDLKHTPMYSLWIWCYI